MYIQQLPYVPVHVRISRRGDDGEKIPPRINSFSYKFIQLHNIFHFSFFLLILSTLPALIWTNKALSVPSYRLLVTGDLCPWHHGRSCPPFWGITSSKSVLTFSLYLSDFLFSDLLHSDLSPMFRGFRHISISTSKREEWDERAVHKVHRKQQ